MPATAPPSAPEVLQVDWLTAATVAVTSTLSLVLVAVTVLGL